MNFGASFSKHRFIYLVEILAGTCLVFILRGSFYEAVVDVSVSPPENIRKTDFSWITVNEWFNGQIYIISSYTLLKDIASDINFERLGRMVYAKRLGASDIIRISVKSEEKPEMLLKLAAEISDLYIKKINEETPGEKKSKESDAAKEISKKDDGLILKNTIEAMYTERAKIKKDIQAAAEQINSYQLSLDKYKQSGAMPQDIKDRIQRIESEISILNRKLTQLRATYTENWPEVSSLKEKLDPLEQEKGRLTSELSIALKNEAEVRQIRGRIDDENKRLAKLKDELNLIDIRLDESLKTIAAKTTPVPEEVKERSSKGMSYAYILNPPTINFLPDLLIQLINSALIALAIWFAIGLYFRLRRSLRPK